MKKSDLGKKISKLYKALKKGDIGIEDLSKYKGEFSEFYKHIIESVKMSKGTKYEDFFDFSDLSFEEICFIEEESKIVREYLQMCNDYYTFSKSGDILITDSEYDEVMNMYTKLYRKDRITTTEFEDRSSATKWDIVKHTNPNMIGSLDKVYTFGELAKFIEAGWDESFSSGYLIMAPKFDGISTALTVVDGKITMALTRKDGYAGQNITEVIRNCSNYDQLEKLASSIKEKRGSIKCEVLCNTENFEELKKITQYSNRRSAVSGIVSTPSNLKYAKYLTVEPILINHEDKVYEYIPRDSVTIHPDDIGYTMSRGFKSIKSLELKVTELLDKFKSTHYPYRVDGVVIYMPVLDTDLYKSDAMKTSIAYKVNTSFGITDVLYGYMSIGRSGVATPMIRVAPCDVNETIVEDVSLSNLKKAEKFNLHEGDSVIIESSGDVIPMLKEVVKRSKKGEKIIFSDRCPYCGSRLRPISEATVGCINANCEKLKSGRIINFLDKMGAFGISDETIFQLVTLKIIDKIEDVFNLKENDLSKIDGWGDIKAGNFIDSVNQIRSKPKSEAEFIGALGIPGVSKKKAENICKVISLRNILKDINDNKSYIIKERLLGEDGFGTKSVAPIIEFFENNLYEVEELSKLFNLVAYQPSIGEVVFTNFRDSDMEEAFKKIGYSIGNSVNRNTSFVICPDPETTNSSKIKMARQKGIKIIGIDEAIRFLKNH